MLPYVGYTWLRPCGLYHHQKVSLGWTVVTVMLYFTFQGNINMHMRLPSVSNIVTTSTEVAILVHY